MGVSLAASERLFRFGGGIFEATFQFAFSKAVVGWAHRSTSLDQIAQIFPKLFTLHCPHSSSSRHSYPSRSRVHLPTSQVHTTPLPKQRSER